MKDVILEAKYFFGDVILEAKYFFGEFGINILDFFLFFDLPTEALLDAMHRRCQLAHLLRLRLDLKFRKRFVEGKEK